MFFNRIENTVQWRIVLANSGPKGRSIFFFGSFLNVRPEKPKELVELVDCTSVDERFF